MSRPFPRHGPRGRSPARADPRAWSFPVPGLSLARSPPEDRPVFWTRALGDPPDVYGERLRHDGEATWRAIDPFRSKLGAALARGLRELPCVPGGRVLYLGAATGTTASHVADLVGRRGTVYAVEKSPRPFQRLLGVARRWPNLAPILGDARAPRTYLPVVPPVESLYLDVAQPDQAAMAVEHARLFLKPGGGLAMAVKGPSLRGREGPTADRLASVTAELARSFELEAPVPLEPFHRGHVFLVGHWRGA